MELEGRTWLFEYPRGEEGDRFKLEETHGPGTPGPMSKASCSSASVRWTATATRAR